MGDLHVKVEGAMVNELQYTFLRDWHFIANEPIEKILTNEYFPIPKVAGDARMRLLNSGPNECDKGQFSDGLFALITGAKKEVLLVSPYFVPNIDLITALRIAALRGVSACVIVPKENNHRYAGAASRALYDELLDAGVQIWEQNPPFRHSKAALIDGQLACIGSANIDRRSLELNYETNLIITQPSFAKSLGTHIRAQFDNATKIDLETWRKRSKWKQLREQFSLLLRPIL